MLFTVVPISWHCAQCTEHCALSYISHRATVICSSVFPAGGPLTSTFAADQLAVDDHHTGGGRHVTGTVAAPGERHGALVGRLHRDALDRLAAVCPRNECKHTHNVYIKYTCTMGTFSYLCTFVHREHVSGSLHQFSVIQCSCFDEILRLLIE